MSYFQGIAALEFSISTILYNTHTKVYFEKGNKINYSRKLGLELQKPQF